MDPKEKDNKWSKLKPEAKLEQLRNLRDVPHKLSNPDHLFDQNWFIGQVLGNNLEATYMQDIAFNNRL